MLIKVLLEFLDKAKAVYVPEIYKQKLGCRLHRKQKAIKGVSKKIPKLEKKPIVTEAKIGMWLIV